MFSVSLTRVLEIEKEINQISAEAQLRANILIKLNRTDLFEISIGRRVLKSELVKDGEFEVYSANVFEPFGKTNQSILSDFSKPSVLWGIDGDWMVNYQKANKPFNPTDHCGVIRVLDESVVNPRYLVHPLLKAGEAERFSRANRASTERIKSLTLLVPDIKIQNETVKKLFELEEEMAKHKATMQNCVVKKQEILDKYLK